MNSASGTWPVLFGCPERRAFCLAGHVRSMWDGGRVRNSEVGSVWSSEASAFFFSVFWLQRFLTLLWNRPLSDLGLLQPAERLAFNFSNSTEVHMAWTEGNWWTAKAMMDAGEDSVGRAEDLKMWASREASRVVDGRVQSDAEWHGTFFHPPECGKGQRLTIPSMIQKRRH